MKPITGELSLSGTIGGRCFGWRIYIGKRAVVEGYRPFKTQRTARNDAVRMAKRLNIAVVERV